MKTPLYVGTNVIIKNIWIENNFNFWLHNFSIIPDHVCQAWRLPRRQNGKLGAATQPVPASLHPSGRQLLSVDSEPIRFDRMPDPCRRSFDAQRVQGSWRRPEFLAEVRRVERARHRGHLSGRHGPDKRVLRPRGRPQIPKAAHWGAAKKWRYPAGK